MEHLNLKTKSNTEFNLEALYQIFPACFTEVCDETTGGLRRVVDFDKLKSFLGGGNIAEDVNESYEFTWVGKQEARREVAKPITKTLRPCIEDSVDWDTTKNLYIEGDNLEVLKLLQNSYMGKVKMIYIDPPYNTGNDFIYHDDFAQDRSEYDLDAGNVDEEGNRFRKNTETNGRFHSDWCSMIYERLLLARNLLSDNGVIFISINDCELSNLKKIADEIFGEANTLVNAIWVNGRTSSAHFTTSHEYVIAYAKDLSKLPLFKFQGNSLITDRTIKKISNKNPVSDITFPAGLDFESEDKDFPNKFGSSEVVEVVSGTLKCRSNKLAEKVTLRAAWTMADMIKAWLKGETVYDQKGQLIRRFFFKHNGILQYEKEKGTVHPNSVITDISTKTGSNSLKELFGEPIFPYPKPIDLIKYFLVMVDPGDIVLDFFAGSSSTAHAVLDLNTQDGGQRNFIMVQYPEICEKDSPAYKLGYINICDIGKERIRRAGQMIKNEKGLIADNLDIGFRVFKCDESNMKDVYFEPKDLQQQDLINFMDNIKEDRTDLDLLFDCMLKWGIQLSEPMDKKLVGESTIYNVNDGDLVACFSEKVAQEVIDQIADLEPLRVVFRDGSFEKASEKMNLFEIFKQKCDWSDEEVRKNVRVI